MKVIFHDGPTFEAPDATGILEAIALVQPERVDSTDHMKRILTVRAHAWLGAVLDPTHDDLHFLDDLADTGFFKISDS